MEPAEAAAGALTQGDRRTLLDTLLEDLLDLPAPQREAAVASRLAGDDATRDSLLQLLSRFENMGDFMETPVFRAPDIRPGDLLLDRFRIVRQLGEGGMGAVFLAEDRQLGEVALKTIRADLRHDAEFNARFRSEIGLSRLVRHPNICPVFDIFDFDHPGGGSGVFFTMQYLRGETLAQRISRGPVPLPEALRLALALAAGLDALHTQGMVHRDLKPGNIMLVPDRDGIECPVIMDFGLVKSDVVPAIAAHTSQTRILGSADYMAPEQFLTASVTGAADIYSFGVILFEVLTGRLPFPKEDLLRTALRRATEEPLLLTAVLPGAPPDLTASLSRALQRDPASRPRSAAAVLQPVESDAPAGPPASSFLSRRAILLAAGTACSVSVFFGIRRFRKGGRVPPPSPTLMLTFVVPQSSPRERELAATTDMLLRAQLRQSPSLRLLAPDRVNEAWHRITGTSSSPPAAPRPAEARQIALRSGSDLLLFGSLTTLGDVTMLELNLELMGQNPDRPDRRWTASFPARTESDLPSAVFEGAEWLRRAAGESAAHIAAHNLHPEELTTASWQALLEFRRAGESWAADQSDAALLHLRTALDLDPGFATAAGRMADYLEALQRHDEAMTWYGAAAELLRRKNLTDRESLRTRGVFSLDSGQYPAAEEIFARYHLEYPEDSLALFYKSSAVELQGRHEEARQLTEAALRREPNSYVYIMKRAVSRLDLKQFDEAEADLSRAASLRNGDWTDLFRAALSFARRDLRALWRSLEKMRTTGSLPYRSRAYEFQACLRAEQGRWNDAEHILLEGLQADRAQGAGVQALFRKQRLLAILHLRLGRPNAAARLCRDLLREKPGFDNTMLLGGLLARAGDIRAAEACLIPNLPPWPICRHMDLRLRGELALARGNAREGLRLMLQAPPGHLRFEWPEYIARAALAANDAQALRRCLVPLFDNPASYWVQADTTGPGFMSWALEASPHAELLPPHLSAATKLRDLLNTES